MYTLNKLMRALDAKAAKYKIKTNTLQAFDVEQFQELEINCVQPINLSMLA